MAIEFSLTATQKDNAKAVARRRVESEVYATAIMAGVDPENLEFIDGNFTWEPGQDEGAWTYPHELRLRQVLNVYQSILNNGW
jgi:hypothetical protein